MLISCQVTGPPIESAGKKPGSKNCPGLGLLGYGIDLSLEEEQRRFVANCLLAASALTEAVFYVVKPLLVLFKIIFPLYAVLPIRTGGWNLWSGRMLLAVDVVPG